METGESVSSRVVHFIITYSSSTATVFLGGAWSPQAGEALEGEERVATHFSPFLFHSSLLLLRGGLVSRDERAEGEEFLLYLVVT